MRQLSPPSEPVAFEIQFAPAALAEAGRLPALVSERMIGALAKIAEIAAVMAETAEVQLALSKVASPHLTFDEFVVTYSLERGVLKVLEIRDTWPVGR